MQVKNVVIPRQLGDADLRLLRVFKSVVECGGMMSAELELNIAVSTISRHIKDLETRLGLVLCRCGPCREPRWLCCANGRRHYLRADNGAL